MTEVMTLQLTSQVDTEWKKEVIKDTFPEIFSDGMIDLERLRTLLGNTVESGSERYGINWAGKNNCIQIIQQPSIGTLKPNIEQSIKFDKSENLVIEGDNLEVLKLLQKSYYGKIKMIYIDPPYNTGNDFIYPDDFSDSIGNYLRLSGQTDSEGRRYTTNPETSGRFHTNWLNMMYPRLYLARNLLREDGIIFISIDDNEVYNLRMVLNEIFGEENFLSQFIRQIVKGGTGPASKIRVNHDYILGYARNIQYCTISGSEVEAEPLDKEDEKGPYRVGRELNKWGAGSRREDSPSMWFPIPGPNGEDVYPIRNDGSEGRWRWGKEKMLQAVAKGDVVFEKRDNGTYVVYEKIRSTAPRRKAYTSLMIDVGTNADGTEELKALFEGPCILDFPKPTSLVRKLIEISDVSNGDYVLDFFAGSGTTAQAVLDIDREQNMDIRFICVQLQEPTPEDSPARKAGFETISQVCIERIKRVIKKHQDEKEGKFDFGDDNHTFGFKVFYLDKSNFRLWDGKNPEDEGKLMEQLELHVDHIDPNSTQKDILYELLLKAGFELTTKVEKIQIEGKDVFSVANGALFICLEDELTRELLKGMSEKNPGQVICLDKGFKENDQLKTNAVQIMKSKDIEFRTV